MNEERELKFRIWVHIDKAFTYFDIYDYPSGIAFGVSYPMQFTGMLDSQGVEVYEGDILKIELHSDGTHIIEEVKFKNGIFGCDIVGGFHPLGKIGPFRVAGNFIEHKHLLD